MDKLKNRLTLCHPYHTPLNFPIKNYMGLGHVGKKLRETNRPLEKKNGDLQIQSCITHKGQVMLNSSADICRT